VEAVILSGWVGIELFVARDANSLATRPEEQVTFAFGADPGEVAEEGEKALFEEADSLCP
jgi:hypothetical protein